KNPRARRPGDFPYSVDEHLERTLPAPGLDVLGVRGRGDGPGGWVDDDDVVAVVAEFERDPASGCPGQILEHLGREEPVEVLVVVPAIPASDDRLFGAVLPLRTVVV